jgi:RNAse H-fold protein YqgF
MTVQGRVLCLDMGERRIGVAISDPLGFCAHPLPAVRIDDASKVLDQVISLVNDHDPALIIVGDPLSMSGKTSETTNRYRDFAARLKQRLEGREVILRDERLSTAAVERTARQSGVTTKKLKKVKDSLSAQWVLQGYLEGRRHGP